MNMMRVKVLRPFTQSLGASSRELVIGDITEMNDALARALIGDGYLAEVAVEKVHLPPAPAATVAHDAPKAPTDNWQRQHGRRHR